MTLHVGVFSYQTGHRKTVEVVTKLLPRYRAVTVFAFPFIYAPAKSRTERWQERPWQLLDFDPAPFYRAHGVRYVEIESWDVGAEAVLDAPGPEGAVDIFLTCIGAKKFPGHFIDGRTVLNCHPALLPQNRGLDAFKWGILNGWPIGASLFVMDSALDRGQLLYRTRTPVLTCDSLDDVARRNYDLECDLTADFERFLPHLSKAWRIADEDGPLSTKLIPKAEDERLAETFLAKRDRFVRLSTDLSAHPHPADSVGDGLRLSQTVESGS